MRLRRFLINEVKGTKDDFAIKNDLKILLGDKIKFSSKMKVKSFGNPHYA